MNPQIRSLIVDLRAASERFAQLAATTPDARWAVRSAPDSWSVGECIAHLNLTARAMQPLLDRASAEARALVAGPTPSLRRSALGAIVALSVGPLPGVGRFRLGRVRTPPAFVPVPGAGESREETVAEFGLHIAAHERALRDADGLPIDKVMVASPFVAGVRYDAWSAWTVLVRHLHRHLAQAERVWTVQSAPQRKYD